MNKFFFNLRRKAANFLSPTKNSMTLPQQFLRYGSRGEPMYPGWGDIQMSDQDHYSGYGYAAIINRATMVARTAIEKVRTESNNETFVHPYLETLDLSPTFSNYQFWSVISTYLDLEGVYYLMVIRASEGTRMGNIKEFKMLNPYNIRRVLSSDQLEVKGYVETRKGMMREIPKNMIIEMRELNPFSEDNPFSMTDAAKESQFTLKTSGDYTRNAIKHNINAPGILSTDIQLEEEDFKNFMSRVSKHVKGEPIFGNGSGAVKWEGMQSELSKAALKDINEINRDVLLATSGVSKTIMGIEQSGTTRETSRVQKELSLEMHILPRIQLILDALNQDYRNVRPVDYERNKALIVVDNPLSVDYEAKLKDTEAKTADFELYSTLIQRGVDNETAAGYVKGEVELEMLKIEPVEVEDLTLQDNPQDDKKQKKDENTVKNQVGQDGLIAGQQSSLENAIINIDQQLLANAIVRLSKKIKNDVELREKDVITQQEQNEAEQDLGLVLLGFYGIVINLQGQLTMRLRVNEFALAGFFSFNRQIQRVIKNLSSKAATSHVETVTNDIYLTAKEGALQGKGLAEIERDLRKKYNEVVSKTRAKAIARSETNRAFTTAQFEADRQFISQNDLEKRAFKQLQTRSDNPCPFCVKVSNEPPIPFEQNFRNLGDTVEADGKTLKINYLPIEAANLHTNCGCQYVLIIKDA